MTNSVSKYQADAGKHKIDPTKQLCRPQRATRINYRYTARNGDLGNVRNKPDENNQTSTKKGEDHRNEKAYRLTG